MCSYTKNIMLNKFCLKICAQVLGQFICMLINFGRIRSGLRLYNDSLTKKIKQKFGKMVQFNDLFSQFQK